MQNDPELCEILSAAGLIKTVRSATQKNLSESEVNYLKSPNEMSVGYPINTLKAFAEIKPSPSKK